MEETPASARLGLLEIVGELDLAPVRIDGDEAILGRDPSSDVVLEDPRVSRRHARVWVDEHLMMIQDLGSKAGTVVNGHSITGPVELHTGDHLRLGLTELAVVWNPGLANTLDMPVLDPEAEAEPATRAIGTVTRGDGAPSDRVRSARADVDLDDRGGWFTRRRRSTPAELPQRAGSETTEAFEDLALDASADNMPIWMRSLLMAARRRH